MKTVLDGGLEAVDQVGRQLVHDRVERECGRPRGAHEPRIQRGEGAWTSGTAPPTTTAAQRSARGGEANMTSSMESDTICKTKSCKFRFLKSNRHMGGSLLLWLAAAVWVDWRLRAAAGVHHGDGDGQAVVQEKEQHLQPSLRGRSTRKSRRASWPPAALYSALRLVREWCRGVERVERVECVERVERSGTVDTVDTR